MKHKLVSVGSVALSAALATAIVLALFSLLENAKAGAIARFLLLPGAAAAEVVGQGAHDLGGILTYVVGNVVFYTAILASIVTLGRYVRIQSQ